LFELGHKLNMSWNGKRAMGLGVNRGTSSHDYIHFFFENGLSVFCATAVDGFFPRLHKERE
jgi:hypothetical protein